MDKKILYTIHSSGVIKALHNIHGPVLTPVALSDNDAIDLIRKGFVVYAHNPYNKQEKIKLNYKNFNKINFNTSRIDKIKKEAKFKEKKEAAMKGINNPNPIVPEKVVGNDFKAV